MSDPSDLADVLPCLFCPTGIKSLFKISQFRTKRHTNYAAARLKRSLGQWIKNRYSCTNSIRHHDDGTKKYILEAHKGNKQLITIKPRLSRFFCFLLKSTIPLYLQFLINSLLNDKISDLSSKINL
jgi:hypothetical protein